MDCVSSFLSTCICFPRAHLHQESNRKTYRGHHLQPRIIAVPTNASKQVRRMTVVSFQQVVSVTLYTLLMTSFFQGGSQRHQKRMSLHHRDTFPSLLVPSARPSLLEHWVTPLPAQQGRACCGCHLPVSSALPPPGSVPAGRRPAAVAEILLKTAHHHCSWSLHSNNVTVTHLHIVNE